MIPLLDWWALWNVSFFGMSFCLHVLVLVVAWRFESSRVRWKIGYIAFGNNGLRVLSFLLD